MTHSFVRGATAPVLAEPEPQLPSKVIIAGTERLPMHEALLIRDALRRIGLRAEIQRMSDGFSMKEFRTALMDCTLLIVAIEHYPGRELELLREAERSMVPKTALICLPPEERHRGKIRTGGAKISCPIDFVVRRAAADMAYAETTRHVHLIEQFNENGAREFAQLIRRRISPT